MLVMKRAVELFALEARSSRSPLVEETWQARSEPEESFISVAATHWEMVVTRQRGVARLTVRGPETKATTVAIPRDAEFFGIQFSLGTFMPGLPPGRLVDRTSTLPQVTCRSFWFDGSAWEVPGPDTADVFVHRLAQAGLLVHDPIVAEALSGDVQGLSTRSVERRVARGVGFEPKRHRADPPGRESGRAAVPGRAAGRRGQPDRLRRPAPLDQIAQALRRADARSDRGLRAVWLVVAGVQDGMARAG